MQRIAAEIQLDSSDGPVRRAPASEVSRAPTAVCELGYGFGMQPEGVCTRPRGRTCVRLAEAENMGRIKGTGRKC
jgi:hypothetical protein